MSEAIIPTREELADFIYYRHKDAYGVKGRFYDFDQMSYEELEKEAIRIDEAAKAQYAYERKLQADAVRDFRANVRNVMDICNASRATAIEYILEGSGHTGEYDAGYCCYCLGLPYSMEKYLAGPLASLNERTAAMEAA
jgi:hypothetical protein